MERTEKTTVIWRERKIKIEQIYNKREREREENKQREMELNLRSEIDREGERWQCLRKRNLFLISVSDKGCLLFQCHLS